jgi:hypothetical protein
VAQSAVGKGFLVRTWFLLTSEPVLSVLGPYVGLLLAANFAFERARKRRCVVIGYSCGEGY